MYYFSTELEIEKKKIEIDQSRMRASGETWIGVHVADTLGHLCRCSSPFLSFCFSFLSFFFFWEVTLQDYI